MKTTPKPPQKFVKGLWKTSDYSVLMLLSMLYVSIMICNYILTNRYIGTNDFFILGGSLMAPLVFILNDIISEIFGYKTTRSLVIFGFIVLTIFTLICQLVVQLPYPNSFHHEKYYSYVLGPSLLRVELGGCAAYFISSLMNACLITHWKKKLNGRLFWLRSIGSSSASELVFCFIAIAMMEFKSISIGHIVKATLLSYSIKVVYSLIFAWPATLYVEHIKKSTGIDVYD